MYNAPGVKNTVVNRKAPKGAVGFGREEEGYTRGATAKAEAGCAHYAVSRGCPSFSGRGMTYEAFHFIVRTKEFNIYELSLGISVG